MGLRWNFSPPFVEIDPFFTGWEFRRNMEEPLGTDAEGRTSVDPVGSLPRPDNAGDVEEVDHAHASGAEVALDGETGKDLARSEQHVRRRARVRCPERVFTGIAPIAWPL